MLLEVQELSISIGKEEAVRSSSFSVPDTGITALIGESGSGKSLTALAISSLLPPGATWRGRILFDGRPVDESLRGKGISYVFQDAASALNPVYTLEKQLKRIDRNVDAERMLRAFGLEGAGHLYPFQLSGGMQMRSELMLSSALPPRLLIADEITAALDGKTAAAIMDILSSLSRSGTAILLITHDIGVARAYADRIAVMHAGETVEEGDAGKVLSSPLHPYTEALLMCADMEKGKDGLFRTIEPAMPAIGERPEGCTYSKRCPHPCTETARWIGNASHRARCCHPSKY